MKKPILKGPKLIAVGPLKCFKGGGGGSGGGGGGGSSSGGGKGGGGGGGSTQSGMMGDVAKERERVRQVERDAQAGRERDAAQARKREEYKKQQAAAEAKAKAEQKRKEDQQRQQAKAKAEAMAKAAQRRKEEQQKQEARVKAEAVAKAEQLRKAREADDSVIQQIDDKKTQDVADDLRIARGADDLAVKQMDEEIQLSKDLEQRDLDVRQAARDRKQLEEAEDLRVARGAEYEEQRDLKIDLAKRKASELSAQRRKEDEQRKAARKKAEEIAFSKTLEQRDLDLRKDARARQEEERTLSRELSRRKSDKALAEEADEEAMLLEGAAAERREDLAAITDEERAEDQLRSEEAYVASQDAKRDRMALMDYEKGLISAQEYGALTGNEKIPRKSVLTRRNFIKALGMLPGGVGAPVKNIAEFINKKVSDPTTMEEAQEDISVEEEKVTKAKEPKPSVAPPVRRGEPKSKIVYDTTGMPTVKLPEEPAPKPEPKPVEQLTPDEVGDSIVKKEAQMIRERSLAQQLASIRGLRGVSPGQKMRLLQRSQERFDREFAPQVQLALMKERESRRKEQQDLSEAEKNRQNALERQKLASGKGVVSSASDKPSWLKGLEAVSTGLNKAEDILGTFDFGNILGGAEGGFVSGPGTETSDSIPARLSDGEFVVKASAVRGLGKSMGAKGKEEQRAKGVDFLYKLQDKMGKVEKFAEGGEAYARPKKAFKEAIGYESESRFHDKAAKDAKHGGARRKFRHFQMGGAVDMKGPGVVKDQFKMPSSGYGAVVSAQGDLMRRLEELERKVGK